MGEPGFGGQKIAVESALQVTQRGHKPALDIQDCAHVGCIPAWVLSRCLTCAASARSGERTQFPNELVLRKKSISLYLIVDFVAVVQK